MNTNFNTKLFKDKTLLITGGTGSFGTAVLNQFANSDLKEIRVFSRDEKKQDDLRRKINNSKVKFYIGDVRDFSSVENVVRGTDFIFHAAALKQVPSCEFFPIEAVKTNILGTENVLEAAINNNVKKVIVLSTDKAVYPINTMGMTKALSEKVMIAKSRNLANNSTILCATRYGNVMASRGSVIPLFIEQIKQKKPITITNPEMTRYLMSLDDALDLVLYAFQHGDQGDIFVQKSPASSIEVLARAMKNVLKSDCEIKIIGTRHGEKLYETLVSREEMVNSVEIEKYFRIKPDTRDLNYNLFFTNGHQKIDQVDEYNSHNTIQLSVEEAQKLLLDLDIIQREL